MRIVIDLPGNITEGLESPERGESRWAQNWAKFLANEGHEVICICSPIMSWGATEPIPNCSLILFDSTQVIDCDIFMHAAWWKGRDIGKINAKTYVHLSYGFEKARLADPTFITAGHVIAYAYEQHKPNFIYGGNPFTYKTFCLPVPLIDKFRPAAFNRDRLTFSAKDIFLNRHYPNDTRWYETGKHVISAIIDISNKYNLRCNFMTGKVEDSVIQGNPHSVSNQLLDVCSKAIEEYGIRKMIIEHKNKDIFGTLPLSKVYELLDMSKMVFPVISPGGSMIEAVCRGVLPLTWSGSLYDIPAKQYNFLLNHRTTYEQVYQNIERAITDEEFYKTILQEYQSQMVGHLYENSRKYFNKLANFREV